MMSVMLRSEILIRSEICSQMHQLTREPAAPMESSLQATLVALA